MISHTLTRLAAINLVPGSGPAAEANKLTVDTWIPRAVNIIFVIAVILFFFYLVLGGVRWITSGGDKGQTEGAKSQITAAVIGLILVLSAYAIVDLIGEFLGITNIFEGLDWVVD